MGRSGKQDAFPLLKAVGLYAAPIKGDGNCLFNALCDQLFGDQKTKAAECRKNTVVYMMEHKDHYKHYIGLYEGGGTRQNPKRKAAGSIDRPIEDITPAQLDAAFEKNCKTMSKGGTWGGNAELAAFANLYAVNIKIYSEVVHIYYDIFADDNAASVKPTLWILHHSWEHYSSIRNIDGPHEGLPEVREKNVTAEGEQMTKEKLAKRPTVEKGKIDLAMESLPFPQNQPAYRPTVQKTLEKCGGDVNHAVSMLLSNSSTESSSHNSSRSSIERDPDSDDEKEQKPSKKRDRRQSRPHPLRNNLAVAVPGQDSVIYSPNAITPNPLYLAAALQKVNEIAKKPYESSEIEEENWKNRSPTKSSSSSSAASKYSSSPPKASNADQPQIRLKLSVPKPINAEYKEASPSSSVSGQSNLADDDTDTENKKAVQDRVIAKPRRRLITGTQYKKELTDQAAKLNIPSSEDAAPTDGLARTNSMVKLDRRINSIRI